MYYLNPNTYAAELERRRYMRDQFRKVFGLGAGK